jgi:broad specificity phosphatase PhoE
MASIYLIRHGQASFGSANYDQLSTLGQRQADVTGEFLSTIGLKIDAAVAGTLSRQQETGARVLAGLGDPCELQTDRRFNEINNEEQVSALLPGLIDKDPVLAEIAGRDFGDSKDYQKIIDAVFNAWVSPDCPDCGITPWPVFRDGVQAALKDIMTSVGAGKNTAVFTSGGTIATAVGLIVGAHHSGFYQFYEPVMNCSITRLIYSSKRVSLSNFNDAAHLELLSAQRQESLVTYR